MQRTRTNTFIAILTRIGSLTWLLLALSAPSHAAGGLLLRNGVIHTASGETIRPGSVSVQDGRIVAVGRELEASGAEVIDLGGKHLYPGLIAATSSLGLIEIGAVRATQDTTEVGQFTPEVRAWHAVNPDSELIAVARANGLTHALAVPMGGVVAGQSGLMALNGWTWEEMTVRSPVALTLYWPNMGLNTTPRESVRDPSRWKSPADQAKERKEKLKELNEFFDEAKAYEKAREAHAKAKAEGFQVIPAWEALLPVIRRDLPIMVHADDVREIRAAVHWAQEREYSIILAGARDAWQVAELLAEHRIPVIYESVFDLPGRDDRPYDIHFRAPAVLSSAGVKVAFSEGTGSTGATQIRNLPYAAAQAVAFGLSPEEALRGLTLYPAQMLGVDDRLGSIETGKEATFFIADGDILDIRSEVRRMWIAGKEVNLESRHTRLYNRYQSRPLPGANR